MENREVNLIEDVKKLAEHKCVSPRDGFVLGVDYYIEQHQFGDLLKLISSYETNPVENRVTQPSDNLLGLLNKITISDINDSPIFTHTKLFREHFDYIKKEIITCLSGQISRSKKSR
jgi:hypothetical protein